MNLAIIVPAMLILLLVLFLSFVVITIYIYRNNCTLRLFLIWLSVYTLLSAFNFLFLSGVERGDIRLYVLNNIIIISFFTSSFFILRIEERCVRSQYIIGLSISLLIFIASTTLYNPTTSFVLGSLGAYLLTLLTIYYFKIILFNKLHKGKKIKYPIIVIVILLCFVCVGYVLSTLHNTLVLLSSIFLIYLTITLTCITCDSEKRDKWLYVDPNEIEQKCDGQKNYLLQRIIDYITINVITRPQIPIEPEPSGKPLCDEVNYAILNNKVLTIEGHDLPELRFMLVCAKMKNNSISKVLAITQNLYLIGLTTIIYPLVNTFYQFRDYVIHQQLAWNKTLEAILPQFIDIYFGPLFEYITSVNEVLGLYFGMLVMFSCIWILLILMSFSHPNSRVKLWIRRHEKINFMYEFIWIFIFSIVSIGFIIKAYLSIETGNIDILVLLCSVIFMAMAAYISHAVAPKLKNAEKIILDLNEAIIFKMYNTSGNL